ncbi:hypothetical protein SELMODRAFT_420589 [Selaginella moellendorffii]|uniref:RING-CH-type domain-containing protein n=1 Tax=Selaginella moellendorffii TaxID=88036 RepID=D8SCG8_SELML|nr:hypothetical protein SELMODRAFT_420589 [Selaginella moellendorffii]
MEPACRCSSKTSFSIFPIDQRQQQHHHQDHSPSPPSLKSQQDECRICLEEDEAGNLEIPCSCCGSLKYAHRKCVQCWCNEKGDTICEICQQPFKGCTEPVRPAAPVALPDDHSRNVEWRSHHQLDPRIMAMAAERNFIQEIDDYAAANASGAACCRSTAVILMALLLLRLTLALGAAGSDGDASTFFTIWPDLDTTINLLELLYLRANTYLRCTLSLTGVDLDTTSSSDNEIDDVPQAFHSFLESIGSTPAAFATRLQLKILETKTTSYLTNLKEDKQDFVLEVNYRLGTKASKVSNVTQVTVFHLRQYFMHSQWLHMEVGVHWKSNPSYPYTRIPGKTRNYSSTRNKKFGKKIEDVKNGIEKDVVVFAQEWHEYGNVWHKVFMQPFFHLWPMAQAKKQELEFAK